MSNRYYITTAISYPNGTPHIGHAYEALATDASPASSGSMAMMFVS
jgi:methionyl-tRNA synthetase